MIVKHIITFPTMAIANERVSSESQMCRLGHGVHPLPNQHGVSRISVPVETLFSTSQATFLASTHSWPVVTQIPTRAYGDVKCVRLVIPRLLVTRYFNSPRQPHINIMLEHIELIGYS
jgi:hypothetical protein